MTYEHRNGESEAPTILGNYWFDGFDRDRPGEKIRELVTYQRDGNDSGQSWLEVWVPGLGTFECGYHFDIENLFGRWWGPVYVPWDDDKE